MGRPSEADRGKKLKKTTVTDLPQDHSGGRPADGVLPAPAVIVDLLRHLDRSAYAAAKLKRIYPRNIRQAARHFSARDVEKLLSLVADDRVRRDYAILFHHAELLRRAQRHHGLPAGADVLDQLTPRSLLHEVGRGQSGRTGSKADYFTMLLFRLQLRCGENPKVANYANLRTLYDQYVARVRILHGEVAAFRNAIILTYAYLGACPFDSAEQRHALLGIAYIAIDLAAQVNDYRWLRSLAKTLSLLTHERFNSGAEKALLLRLILDARSRADRYSPQFDYDPKVRREAGELAREAVEPAAATLRAVGDLAYAWPEATVGWLGSYFGLLNHGINVGWPPDRLREMFDRHDELAMAIRRIAPGATLLTEATADESGRDAYAAEFLSTLALPRENPTHNLRPRGADYKRAFAPDQALAIAARALSRADPENHYGDSIVGGLQLARAEALLCRAGRGLTESVRDEYEHARRQAATVFARLGMPRKMLHLDRLELRAGIIRSEERASTVSG